jgi:lipoprotein-anchoring transpeptidase ErfK/SrfK
VDAKGTASTATTNFTTMPKPDGEPIVSTLDLRSGGVYGVGMPVVLNFSAPIPSGNRADVERRLSVKSDPPQPGVWHWYGDQQVIYRPKDHWQPGTKLAVSTPLGGLPVAGRYLDTHRTVEATIGHRTGFQITNATKQMQVFRDDKLIKSFPVSLGAPETPSSSGNMVIMTREPEAYWVYGGGYALDVRYVERLTGDGEYIHAAPWSVDDQGRTNVSHGCTNLSPENAEWVYKNSQIGDPVTVTGTEKRLARDNGWTVWDMSWADYVKGSALHQQSGGAPPHQTVAGTSTGSPVDVPAPPVRQGIRGADPIAEEHTAIVESGYSGTNGALLVRKTPYGGHHRRSSRRDGGPLRDP